MTKAELTTAQPGSTLRRPIQPIASSQEEWMNKRPLAIMAIAIAIAFAGCDRGMTAPEPSRAPTGHGPHLDGPRPSGNSASDGTPSSTLFPLALSEDRRNLVDTQGQPFLIQADSAWSLVAELSDDDTIRYLDDRARRGFDAILISVPEPAFTHHSPPWANAAGEEPFADVNDWTTENEAYFAHVDWVLRELDRRGMLALVAPAYLGYDCSPEGWCTQMFANGVERLQEYGRYIGARYRDFPNIMWVQGGDLTPSTSGEPSQMDLVNAVANGIAEGDDGLHYHAAHWSRGTSGADLSGLTWLDIDTTYATFEEPVYEQMLADYARDEGVMPLLLLEASYENEHDTSMLRLRSQMYQAVLSGGCGFVFGNFPIWRFWDPGDPGSTVEDGAFPGGWATALGSPGSESSRIAGEFFRSLPWQDLQPDLDHEIVTAGAGTIGDETYALAAGTRDHATVIIYFTGQRTVTIDMGAFPGPTRARFFDPALGSFTDLHESPFPNSGVREISPPEKNGDGSPDWLLILEAA